MGRPRSCDKKAFTAKAIEIHKDKYNYDNIVFINLSKKIEISRNDCAYVFMQTPFRHLQGSGCQKCALQKLADVKRLTFDEFKLRAKNIHNDNYHYSRAAYANTSNKIEIIHKLCGNSFAQE